MAKSDEKQFIIPFVGLKLGKHAFEFDITDSFFEKFEYSIIQTGNVRMNFSLDKKETMMVGEFELEGLVNTGCDRCNDPIEVPIEGNYRLVYKFTSEETDDESLIVVRPEEYEIDLRETFLELMAVSLPSRAVHDEGECNEEMLGFLDEYLVNAAGDDENHELDEEYNDEEEEFDSSEEDDENDGPIDPRWAALKGLNNKK